MDRLLLCAIIVAYGDTFPGFAKGANETSVLLGRLDILLIIHAYGTLTTRAVEVRFRAILITPTTTIPLGTTVQVHSGRRNVVHHRSVATGLQHVRVPPVPGLPQARKTDRHGLAKSDCENA